MEAWTRTNWPVAGAKAKRTFWTPWWSKKRFRVFVVACCTFVKNEEKKKMREREYTINIGFSEQPMAEKKVQQNVALWLQLATNRGAKIRHG